MSKDIDEMEKMLNDYLQYAKTQSQENTTNINLNEMFLKISMSAKHEKVKVLFQDQIIINGRSLALKRCFENLIQNGLTYGKNVNVNLKKGNNRVSISIEDDGPGIPEDQYKKCIQAFL